MSDLEITKAVRASLMKQLLDLQNSIDTQDIVTISACMSNVELAKHIERYSSKAGAR